MDGSGGGDGAMAEAALRDFRRAVYRGLRGWADALFELSDALLEAGPPVGSVPALSLEPVFRRGHGSLYKALAHGRVDAARLRSALLAVRPTDWPAVFAVDASTWPRCDAETSPERGFYYHPSRHSAGQPIVAGWSYQWIAGLSFAPDSWTAPLDVARLRPADTATDTTLAQVRRVTERPRPGRARSRCSCSMPATTRSRSARASPTCGRPSACASAPTVSSTPTPSCRRRARSAGRSVTGRASPVPILRRWPTPDATTACDDPATAGVEVAAWHGLHPKLQNRGRWAGTHAPDRARHASSGSPSSTCPGRPPGPKKTLWLWWSGPGTPDLDVCWRAYLRRFDLEHTFRFVKHTLGWTTPALRTPEQADRWTWLVIAAYTELRLARRLVDDQRLPWERPLDPAQLTPARVRRGFRRLRASLGTPASPPKSSKPGPGRPKGTRRPPRTRYPAVKKTTPRV